MLYENSLFATANSAKTRNLQTYGTAVKNYINDYYNTSNYSTEKYLAMAKNFRYLTHPYDRSYIATHRLNNGKFAITDGLHRKIGYRGI